MALFAQEKTASHTGEPQGSADKEGRSINIQISTVKAVYRLALRVALVIGALIQTG